MGACVARVPCTGRAASRAQGVAADSGAKAGFCLEAWVAFAIIFGLGFGLGRLLKNEFMFFGYNSISSFF